MDKMKISGWRRIGTYPPPSSTPSSTLSDPVQDPDPVQVPIIEEGKSLLSYTFNLSI